MQIIKTIFFIEAYFIYKLQIIFGHPTKYKKIIKLTKIFTSLKYSSTAAFDSCSGQAI